MFYAYILCYVDDLFVVHHKPRHIRNKTESFLPPKPDSISPLERYLGEKLRKKTFEDGTRALDLSPLKYAQQAGKNVKTFLKNLDERYSFSKRAKKPFPCGYAPEEYVSRLLEPNVAKF